MLNKKNIYELKKICGSHLATDVDLKNYSYLKTGGVARCFITIDDRIIRESDSSDFEELTGNTAAEEKLEEIVRFLISEDIEYLVLGRATNVLIKDGYIDPVIIYPQFHTLPDIPVDRDDEETSSRISFPASIPLIRALKICHQHRLKGMEFVIGIPGSVGGAVVMNAGVKELEIKNVLSDIRLLRDGYFQEVNVDDLDLKYRYSNIISKEIISQARFELTKVSVEEVATLKSEVLEQLEQRKKTQPLKQFSLGSTFKNPLPEYAGNLIEKCGLIGTRCGGIHVSNRHANFIINDGTGTTTQALALIKIIQETVFAKTGISLELEIRKFGF